LDLVSCVMSLDRIITPIYSIDLSNDYAELGATYNTFSLDESGDLAKAIEKIGQAIDSCFVATGNLVGIENRIYLLIIVGWLFIQSLPTFRLFFPSVFV